eukprot:436762-Rhodomonas_salina.1
MLKSVGNPCARSQEWRDLSTEEQLERRCKKELESRNTGRLECCLSKPELDIEKTIMNCDYCGTDHYERRAVIHHVDRIRMGHGFGKRNALSKE